RCYRDWSSDVCSSDLLATSGGRGVVRGEAIFFGRRGLREIGLIRMAVRKRWIVPDRSWEGMPEQMQKRVEDGEPRVQVAAARVLDRKSTRLNSSHGSI